MWGRAEEGDGPVSLPYSLLLQEGMLRNLQKSVEEEEQVWKAKVGAAEQELQKVSCHVHFPRAGGTGIAAGLREAQCTLLKTHGWVEIPESTREVNRICHL